MSNCQLGQRARREHERTKQPLIQSRFFTGLKPSGRQRAQLERAKNKRSLSQQIHDFSAEDNISINVSANILGASVVTNLVQSTPTLETNQLVEQNLIGSSSTTC